MPLPERAQYFQKPPQNKLREIYAMCDVFLVGSRSEGFGLPILEAMACRCPVIATRTGCAPDVIRDGKNGYVVEIEDHVSMAEKIIKISELSNSEWQVMSETASQNVADYTWNDAADLFENALTSEP